MDYFVSAEITYADDPDAHRNRTVLVSAGSHTDKRTKDIRRGLECGALLAGYLATIVGEKPDYYQMQETMDLTKIVVKITPA